MYSFIRLSDIDGKRLPKDRHGTQDSRGRSGAVTPGEAEWRCVTGRGGVVLLHRERRSGAVSPGEEEWCCYTGRGGVALCHRGRRSGAVSPGEAEWHCDIGGGAVALWHRERRSGTVTSGEAEWRFDIGEATLWTFVTWKLVKKNYIKEQRKRYISYTDNSVMCRGRCREKCVSGDSWTYCFTRPDVPAWYIVTSCVA